jgi:hypothetical protein
MVGYILVAKSWLAKRWPDKSAYLQCLLVIGGFAGVLILLYGIFRYLGNWEGFYFWGWKYNFTFLGGLTWPFFFRRFFGMTPRFIFVWLILWIFAFAAIKPNAGRCSSRDSMAGRVGIGGLRRRQIFRPLLHPIAAACGHFSRPINNRMVAREQNNQIRAMEAKPRRCRHRHSPIALFGRQLAGRA